MFTCCECGQKKKEKERSGTILGSSDVWCISCFEKEMKRSSTQDHIGGYFKSRPPKCMLDKSEYKTYGY